MKLISKNKLVFLATILPLLSFSGVSFLKAYNYSKMPIKNEKRSIENASEINKLENNQKNFALKEDLNKIELNQTRNNISQHKRISQIEKKVDSTYVRKDVHEQFAKSIDEKFQIIITLLKK